MERTILLRDLKILLDWTIKIILLEL